LSKLAKKWVKPIIQAAVSACLIVIVLSQIDLAQVASLVLRPQGLPWLLFAFLFFNLSKVGSALRLNIYQRHASIILNEGENLRLYYAGMFLNVFLPGGIGGDGYKILVLHRQQEVPLKKLVMITLADRISGLLALLLLLCLLVPMLALPWPSGIVQIVSVSGGTGIVAAFVLGHRLLLKLRGARVAAVFWYGMGVQTLQLVTMLLLLVYLQAPTNHYLSYLAVFLVSSVAAVLPISFGGLGAREITFFYGLSLLQLEPTHGVLASSGFFLITLASSMLGALFLGNVYLKKAQ